TLGIGFIAGDPTGLSAKVFLSQRLAIDGAAGIGFLQGTHFAAHMDLLWHFPLNGSSERPFDFYIGVGPKIGIFGDKNDNSDGPEGFQFGARVPVGFALSFKAPLDIFIEAAPGLWIINEPDFDFDGGAGIRFWF